MALFRDLGVNLRARLCGVLKYASARALDFLDLAENCSPRAWKPRIFRDLGVNLRARLCGVLKYASARALDFLDLAENCSPRAWKPRGRGATCIVTSARAWNDPLDRSTPVVMGPPSWAPERLSYPMVERAEAGRRVWIADMERIFPDPELVAAR